MRTAPNPAVSAVWRYLQYLNTYITHNTLHACQSTSNQRTDQNQRAGPFRCLKLGYLREISFSAELLVESCSEQQQQQVAPSRHFPPRPDFLVATCKKGEQTRDINGR